MSKTPCKGIKKDGSPCQGNGLDQFDGHCIAHGPAPAQAHEWRSLGGKNSATAARIDKRIPERLKDMLDTLDDGMKKVMDGTLSPSAYTAVCRGVKMRLEVYRQADQDMDHIRTEEAKTDAAQLAGAPANFDIFQNADTFTTQLEQYRAESLAAQGFAELKEQSDKDEPPQVVLNDKGRRRFGYHNLDFAQQMLDEVETQFEDYESEQSDAYEGEKSALPDVHEITDLLDVMENDIEETRSRLASDPAAPIDPLTGHPFTALPARVKPGVKPYKFIRIDDSPQEVMADQRNKIKDLMLQAKELSEDEDYKRKRAKIESHNEKLDELGSFLEAQEKTSPPLTTAPAVAVGA